MTLISHHLKFIFDEKTCVTLTENVKISTISNGFSFLRFPTKLGEQVALLLGELNDNEVSYSNLHLIGHSFGANVASSAGKYTQSFSNTKVARYFNCSFYHFHILIEFQLSFQL